MLPAVQQHVVIVVQHHGGACGSVSAQQSSRDVHSRVPQHEEQVTAAQAYLFTGMSCTPFPRRTLITTSLPSAPCSQQVGKLGWDM